MCELDINPKKVKLGKAVKDIAEDVKSIKNDKSVALKGGSPGKK